MREKRNSSASESGKREKPMLYRRKKGKLKEATSDTRSPEVDRMCSENLDGLDVTKEGQHATATEETRKRLIPKKKKRKEKTSQGVVDNIKKKERREKMSQGDVDSTEKKKRRKKMSQGDVDSTKKKKRREKKSGVFSDNVARSEKNEALIAKIGEKSTETTCDTEQETVKEISSVDEDCSRGMRKWLIDYQQRRPGLEIVQPRLSEFMDAYEVEQEKARKEREALAAEGGWTVVVHHKGRKKTTDSESGIAVGSVAQVAVEEKMAKKKQKELALDFYRFQKREAQRNEVMMLQSKFEQDKKRLQQLRAARKFRPY